MIIFPAIDIKDNKCVRLTQGDFNKVTVYDNDLVGLAKKWENMGAEYLHIVDLDGARNVDLINRDSIKEICETVNIPIQVGGGVRTKERAVELISIGVSRVIIGTMAIEEPELLKELVEIYGDKIAVGVDAKNGKVATRGWEDVTEVDSVDLIKDMVAIGIKTVIYTDISKDGMLSGPNFEIYEELNKIEGLDVVASGGVTSIEDIKRLRASGSYGAIVGKALYDKRIDLKEALTC